MSSPATKSSQLISGAFKALDSAANRTIHVKIHPRPRNLQESRQVLQELKSYGEIEVFHHRKYNAGRPAPNSCIVVYRSLDAAKRAIEDNLREFRYAGASTESYTETSSYSHYESYARPCKLVMRSAAFQHLPYIERQAYYWPMDVDYESGNPGKAIIAKVPQGLQGLRDFDVVKDEVAFGTKDYWSRLKRTEIEKKGWQTLDELWELGQKEREGTVVKENKTSVSTL